MKMADYFDLSVSYIVLGVRDCSVIDDVDRNLTPCDAAEYAVRNHDRLVGEMEALRESLRLKEAECEAFAHDKSVLLSFVKRVSELDIEDWNYETDDGDGMCFEFIGDTEIACDAVDLLEDIKNAGKGGE